MEKHYDLNTDQNAKREIMGGLELRKILLNRVSKVRLHKIWESADNLRSNFGRICKQSLVFFKKRILAGLGFEPGTSCM